jgi:hypothetical protein
MAALPIPNSLGGSPFLATVLRSIKKEKIHHPLRWRHGNTEKRGRSGVNLAERMTNFFLEYGDDEGVNIDGQDRQDEIRENNGVLNDPVYPAHRCKKLLS